MEQVAKVRGFGISRAGAVGMTLLFLLSIALDQVSKYLVLANIRPREIIPVIPNYFNLTLTFNRGAAFGMLSQLPDGTRQIVLAVTTLVALSAVLYFLMRDYHGELKAQLCLAMILGGAFGNIIDRLYIGAVVDFIDVYWGEYHWPAFNVADSSIFIGVALLILMKPVHHKRASMQ